jgi:hypothetical protein
MGLLALGAVSALAVVAVAFAVLLVRLVRADGYGYRAASGLPRDWKPRDWAPPGLPSTPYSRTPPR